MKNNNLIPPKKVLKNRLCSVYGCNNLTYYSENRGTVFINLCKEHREYSKCIRCLGNEWCKTRDDFDLSLNDCNDFVDSVNFIDLFSYD